MPLALGCYTSTRFSFYDSRTCPRRPKLPPPLPVWPGSDDTLPVTPLGPTKPGLGHEQPAGCSLGACGFVAVG